jgi:hypothetical protein
MGFELIGCRFESYQVYGVVLCSLGSYLFRSCAVLLLPLVRASPFGKQSSPPFGLAPPIG